MWQIVKNEATKQNSKAKNGIMYYSGVAFAGVKKVQLFFVNHFKKVLSDSI